ncbi:hypothetical protein LEP1GSC193_3038 [Leptospira alstonii serovar Pingchang str. 80-412]|uniref:Uncharacterized protein n=2 Tax=Leptospira alstonii TaxID=28452 RepID=M6CMD0_9LEPT|nr:hypothetical protein LEP1GSC194_4103 [Leptospira alstonii serovar Sichuan str. 79601]EQA79647.1 hypothetical protein LEP1GSC193_3038 [Leptospira alstonii serovar Pingchang str. 80-412]
MFCLGHSPKDKYDRFLRKLFARPIFHLSLIYNILINKRFYSLSQKRLLMCFDLKVRVYRSFRNAGVPAISIHPTYRIF